MGREKSLVDPEEMGQIKQGLEKFWSLLQEQGENMKRCFFIESLLTRNRGESLL